MQQPNQYDYGDSEFWENFGNPPNHATHIAMCFPEFWQYAYSWPTSQELARIYRHYYWAYSEYAEGSNPFLAAQHMKGLPADDPQRPVPFLLDDVIWNKVVQRATALTPSVPVASHKPADPSVRKRTRLSGGTIYVSGNRLTTQRTLYPANHQYSILYQGPQWGPVRLPPSAHNGHYCIVGMTRSGKTVLIRQLAASLKNQCRLVVYDDKTDLVPFFSAKPDSPAAPLFILNPFDSRSVAWDIAKDASAPHRADEIAHVLIPHQPNQNPYFVETSRALVASTMNALNRRLPGKWTFLDLLIALDNIQAVLRHDEPSRRVFDQHLAAANETAASLLSTLAGHVRPFKTAAAAWSHATERLSITEWARSATGTLVLGNHANYEYAMRNINRVLLHLLARALLDPAMRSKNVSLPRTYIILDELPQLHELEKLEQLLNQGAGLGINLVLGFQDIQTLRKHYGKATDGLIGQCAHFAFFRIGNPTTAQWASTVLGTQELLRPAHTTGTVGDQKTTTTSRIHTEQPIVSVTTLQQIPLTTPEHGMRAVFKSICLPTYRARIPGELLFLGVRYKSYHEIPESAWRAADLPFRKYLSGEPFPPMSYLPLDPASASGLSPFEGRPEEHLFFPEEHSPHLERLGFIQATTAAPPAPAAAPPPAKQNDFDPDSFPRLRGRRPPKETR